MSVMDWGQHGAAFLLAVSIWSLAVHNLRACDAASERANKHYEALLKGSHVDRYTAQTAIVNLALKKNKFRRLARQSLQMAWAVGGNVTHRRTVSRLNSRSLVRHFSLWLRSCRQRCLLIMVLPRCLSATCKGS